MVFGEKMHVFEKFCRGGNEEGSTKICRTVNEEASSRGTDFERCIARPAHGCVILYIHEQKLQKSKTKRKMRCIFLFGHVLKATNGIFLE